jgi:hypothetical protein
MSAAGEDKKSPTVFVVVLRIVTDERFYKSTRFKVCAVCSSKEKAVEVCDTVLKEYSDESSAFVNEVEMNSAIAFIDDHANAVYDTLTS